MNIRQFISSQYLLDPKPNPEFTLLWLLVISFGLLFLAASLMSLTHRPRKWLWRDQLAQWLRWLSILALSLLFARYESLPYLGSRLNWYILLVVFLIWLAYIWRKIRLEQPAKSPDDHYDTFEKYLPRPRWPNNGSKRQKG